MDHSTNRNQQKKYGPSRPWLFLASTLCVLLLAAIALSALKATYRTWRDLDAREANLLQSVQALTPDCKHEGGELRLTYDKQHRQVLVCERNRAVTP